MGALSVKRNSVIFKQRKNLSIHSETRRGACSTMSHIARVYTVGGISHNSLPDHILDFFGSCFSLHVTDNVCVGGGWGGGVGVGWGWRLNSEVERRWRLQMRFEAVQKGDEEEDEEEGGWGRKK